MSNTPRVCRTNSRICYKEDSSIEESASKSSARDKRKSKSCSPSSNRKNRTLRDISSKENSFRKGSVKCSNDEVKQFEIKNCISVVLTDLNNLQLGNVHSNVNCKTEMRKSMRPKRKSTRLIGAEESQRHLKKTTGKCVNDGDLVLSDSDSNILKEKSRTTALFSDDDIEGKEIFGFQTAKNKDLVFKKILENSKLTNMEVDGEPSQPSITTPRSITRRNKKSEVSTPQTPRTPRSYKVKSPELSKCSTPKSARKECKFVQTPTRRTLLTGFKNQDMAATPKDIRNKIKKEIAKQIDSDEVSDFSADDSEYKLSEEESEESDEKQSSSSSDSCDETADTKRDRKYKTLKTNNRKEISNNTRGALRNIKRKEGNAEYVLASDNYFTMRSAKKNLTSNHTMDRLKNPQLTDDKLQDMMENISISTKHARAIENLNNEHFNLFDKWIYYMSEGYNILLYGIGSKRDIIDEFLKYGFQSIDIPCFVVNGYFPGLTVKDVIKSIMIDLLDLPSAPTNIYDAFNTINSYLNSQNIEIALAVHNIDGPMLRNDKAQYVFSKLASLKNIYFIASMDHIRAPLFWGSSKLRSFNYSWWDVTTMKPYVEETVNENLSLVHKSGVLALSSLKNVFLSLNVKARGIFFIIARKQISGSKTSHYQGLSYQELYSLSRESFLVSSDFALRTQLTEFIDHKLIKMKRTVDGAEHLSIPIDNKLLQVFMEQQEI